MNPNFYVRNTVFRSDRGSEFINVSVLDVCGRHGCVPEYSFPEQVGKYQNGVVEKRNKEIGRMGRSPTDYDVYCGIPGFV